MTKKMKLPILPLRDPELIVFPGLFCEVDVGRKFSLNAINMAKASDSTIIMAMQSDATIDKPEAKDFHGICTEAEIRNILPLDNEGTKIRVILKGLKRAILKTVGPVAEGDDLYLYGEVEIVPESTKSISVATKESANQIKELVSEHLNFITIEETSEEKELNMASLSALVDNIAGQLPIPGSRRLHFLRLKDPVFRLKEVLAEVVELVRHSEAEYDDAEPETQEDSDHSSVSEVKKLQKRINDAGMPPHAFKVAKTELKRLSMMAPNGSEFVVTFNYIDRLISMPWDKLTEDKLDIAEAEKSLDADHYGLKDPKKRILEYLSVKKLMPTGKGPILCFVGPPGVGKTSLGRSVAKAMGREFVRMSLGGVNDEAEIRGHRRTYIGSIPGRIMNSLRECGSRNPVFMLDEVDKVSTNFRGDPESALLEILDPEQNSAFTDHYLEVPFDLSQVLFIATANEVQPIKPALADRMEIINIPGYSPYDKVKIARAHLVPKKKKENGLEEVEIGISTNALNRIVDEYTNEAGVRSLERECGAIMRKVAVLVASEKEHPKLIKVDMIPKLLGPPKMFAKKAMKSPEVGLSAGLAWSRTGGSLLFVETSSTPGKGKIELTGKLGEVIRESGKVARMWIKSNAKELNVDLKRLEECDIHIHFPAGATPKDGPSGGIAIAAAMLSLIQNKPVRNDTAMTGEITLHGRVLPIGGLKEKILAAHRAGIKQVIYPEYNKHDLEDLPTDVLNDLTLIPVSNVRQALDILIMDEDAGDSTNNITPGNGESMMNKEPA
jgi:ATP-dependent Lon protease